MIELNTARYADNFPHVADELTRLKVAADAAKNLDLELAAGHGLTHHNLPLLVEQVPQILEYNIGHSIIARAIFCGLDRAVEDLLEMIRHPQQRA